jgi:hypothetical protein
MQSIGDAALGLVVPLTVVTLGVAPVRQPAR